MINSGKYIVVLAVIIIAVFLILLNVSNKSPKDKSLSLAFNKQSLFNADKNFYDYSIKNGTGRAFIDFADDSVILLRQQQFPIVSKKELAKHYINHESEKTTLKWEPVKANVSEDGTLGYTFGKWNYTELDKDGKKSISYGNYVTIWKKQKDGSWKYILDGGSTTPPDSTN